MDIKFTYSPQYDFGYKGEKSPVLLKRLKTLQNYWDTKKTWIEALFEGYTNLSFKKKQITCYLNHTESFSNPLSLKIESESDMRDNLIHELCHVILTQNNIGDTKKWKTLQKDYKSESDTTRSHILVHALHALITPERLKQIKSYSQKRDYIRSWKIVEKESPKELIKQYIG